MSHGITVECGIQEMEISILSVSSHYFYVRKLKRKHTHEEINDSCDILMWYGMEENVACFAVHKL